MPSLFESVGEHAVRPTDLSRGPWSPDHLHGGPVAALLARSALAALADLPPMFPARLRVELLAPVPVADLAVEAELRRPGRRVAVADASVRSGDQIVATATLGAIRDEPGASPASDRPVIAEPPSAGRPRDVEADAPTAFHTHGVEHRFVRGMIGEPGPATDWIRPLADLVDGEPAGRLERVALAADFGNGISGLARFDDLLYINPDLSIALFDLPDDEWIGLDGVTHSAGRGVGVATCDVYGSQGLIGRSDQTLLMGSR